MVAAGDINNSNYTVQADEDIVMNATNINNISTAASATIAAATPTKIEAGSMVSLNATNNITNLGATIKAGELVYLTAGNDIVNKALIDYKINGASATESEAINSNANNIRSTLISQGIIESAGNIVLVAGNDISNQGSKITSTGSTLLEATNGDINITTSILRDRTFESGGKKKNSWTRTSDTTTNLGSEITSGGDLFLTSGAGDINITGSKLTSSNNTEIVAANDVNISAAQNTTYNSFSSSKKGNSTFGSNSRSNSSSSSSTTQIESELTTTNNGDILITSGSGNADTIGSAGAKGSLGIVASNLATRDDDGNSSNNSSSGNINLIAKENLNILSALNSSYSESSSSKKGSSSLSTSKNITLDQTNVTSDLVSNGDINLVSGSNTTITASNLSGTNGSILVGKYTDPSDPTSITYNPAAALIIQSGQDLHYTLNESMKIKTDGTAVAVGIIAAVAVTAATGGAGLALVGAGAGGAVTGMQGKKGKTSTEETTSIIQVSSILNFTNDLTVQSASDVTITASKLTANNATILTGKFRDSLGVETVTNTDAQLNINSAFDTYKQTSTGERVKPNYVGIAVVAGASAYIGNSFMKAINPVTAAGPQVPMMVGGYLIPSSLAIAGGLGYTGYSGYSNNDPNHKSFMDPILNIRSKSSSSILRSAEVRTDLNFNNLTTE